MAARREKLEQLKNVKKRPRIPSLEEDSIQVDEERAAQQQMAQTSTEQRGATSNDESADEENQQPVQFRHGATIRGALCLWHRDFRYIQHSDKWFRCEQRATCPATAKLLDEDCLIGYLGRNDHNHGAAPSRRDAEIGRAQMKKQIKENPAAKTSRLRADVRTEADDEMFELLGTNEALDRMTQRAKNKLFGNVNRENVLDIQIPQQLLDKNGESILLYDSRKTRPGESDVVLVFSHSSLLDLLKRNRRWSLDGTFRTAPKPWKQVFIIGCYINNRLTVAVQALLPGKKSSYYKEVLEQVRQAVNPALPAKVMLDFEVSMLKSMRTIFPDCQRSGCNFHFAQSLFRKAKNLGIFNLFGEDNEEAEIKRKAVHKTFRSVLSLALIPPEHVRRAFSLIVTGSTVGMQSWLSYFARNYIGITQFENDRGAVAFDPDADVGRLFLRRTLSASSVARVSSTSNPPVLFGQLSPQPSTPTMSASEDSSMRLLRRWELEIVRPPRFPIAFWNVFDRAQAALERTNNGMEASHMQFARDLNHHPALSDFIAALIKDVDKQLDIGRAERLQKSRRRPKKFVIKEQDVVRILDGADFDNDLLDTLHLLGLVMQGFVGGLHTHGNDQESGDETDED